MNIEELCKGHITKITSRCKKCLKDDYNKNCANYEPVYLVIYSVGEATTDLKREEGLIEEGGLYI